MNIDAAELRELLADGPSAVATLLANHSNPTVRLLSELWAQQAAQSSDDDLVPDLDDAEAASATDPTIPSRGASASARRRRLLVRRLVQAERALDELGEFADALAAALGACARCWGDDPACPKCRGTGHPGATLPDRKLYARFVAPAVRRVAAMRSAAHDAPNGREDGHPIPTTM